MSPSVRALTGRLAGALLVLSPLALLLPAGWRTAAAALLLAAGWLLARHSRRERAVVYAGFGLFLAVALLAVGCRSGAPQASTEPAGTQAADASWSDIQAKGYFTVGLDDAFPPMGFRDEETNEIVGFDIDLAKEAAKRMGTEVEFKPIDWS
nr:transporter substrate-binding domain-containing protein [Thermoanaerobaculia bacterium]